MALLVLGYWVGVWRLFHHSLFPSASRVVLPQDPSTESTRSFALDGPDGVAVAVARHNVEVGRLPVRGGCAAAARPQHDAARGQRGGGAHAVLGCFKNRRGGACYLLNPNSFTMRSHTPLSAAESPRPFAKRPPGSNSYGKAVLKSIKNQTRFCTMRVFHCSSRALFSRPSPY